MATSGSTASGWLTDHRAEVLAVLIISFTAILTAWTTFQSSKWSGEQSIAFADAATARVESNSYYSDGAALFTVDVQVFLSWLTATIDGDEALADVIAERFPPTLDEAMGTWLALDPFDNPAAPRTPFEDYDYPDDLIGEELEDEADTLHQQGLVFNQRSDNYTAMAIVFATVILFAALADKVPGRRTRGLMLLIASLGLVSGVLVMTAFPVTV